MATTEKVEVAIIGGGFGGLTLAIGLQKYPHLNVNVYEGAQKFEEIGAGIVLGPNSQKSMERIDPRIREGYDRVAAFTDEVPDANGKYSWMTIRKGQAPDAMELVIQFRYPLRSSKVHRAHFLDALVKLVSPESVHFGKRVERFYATDDLEAPVVLRFQDGTSVEADVVVGCDGVHSPTRKHILGAQDPAATATFTGGRVYRAVVPIEAVHAKLGPDFVPGNGLYCGKDGSAAAFPVAGGRLYNIGITTFNMGPWKHDEWIVPADLTALKAHFADWDPWIQKNVELLPEGSTQEWSIWDMPPARTFYRGKVAMLGDAAHASTPFQGAGAGQAIEDALVLATLLGHCLDPATMTTATATTIARVLQTYDAVRRFRSQKVCVTSRETGRIISGNEPGVGMSAAALGAALEGRQEWIWGLEPATQVHDAMLIYESFRAAGERTGAGDPA